MIDYLGYITVKFCSFILCLLPVRLSLFIGRSLGSAMFMLNKRRAKAYKNLKAAFSREKSPAEIRRILKNVYQNLGQVLVETLRFPVVDRQYINKFIAIKGFEKIKAARSQGKGVLILTGHFGNWELSGLIGSILDLPLSVLAREQKHSRLNELLNSYREMAGAKVIKKGMSTRMLIRALRSNEIVGILMDQDAGKLGTFVDFFGRPTSTHSGAFIFAQKTGARMLPVFMVREKGPYHTAHVLDPIGMNYENNSKEEIVRGIQEFSKRLEAYIRKFPSQWLWLHKRWKSTPRRSIVILNDGRTGHLNQSIAAAEMIQRFRQARGYAKEDTVYSVIDIRYRNLPLKVLIKACAAFSSSSCQGCMRCVKFALDNKSYRAFISAYADIVISCGDSLAALNVLLARELSAKNITIMKPGFVALDKFSLAIVPRHDNPPKAKNVVITTGAPNRITPEILEGEAFKLLSLIDLKKGPRLGLIIGGENPNYIMRPGLMKQVISKVKEISLNAGLEILVTTSRRTPKAIESLLKEELAGFPNCRLLVIANEKNMEGVIPAILGLSAVILVSGESISMVSEAASSGRPVLVFPLEKRGRSRTRHERLIGELAKAGFIKAVRPDKIGDEINSAIKSREASKRLDDHEVIHNALGAIV